MSFYGMWLSGAILIPVVNPEGLYSPAEWFNLRLVFEERDL